MLKIVRMRIKCRGTEQILLNIPYYLQNYYVIVMKLGRRRIIIKINFIFLFYAIFLLYPPRAFPFLRGLSPFSASFPLSPRAFSFLCEISPFLASFLLSPWAFSFLRELSPFSVAVMGHRKFEIKYPTV